MWKAEAWQVKAVAFCTITAIALQRLTKRTVTGTLEDVVRDEIGRVVAPVIALAGPRDRFLGASRLRVTANDKDWPLVVANLSVTAKAILLIPGSSEGILRELLYLAQSISPQKVFLFFISDDLGHDAEKDWLEQRQLLADCGWFLPAENPGAGSVITFDANRIGAVVAQNAATFRSYVAPVAKAMGVYYPADPVSTNGDWRVGI
jgi:hypothetical protein